MLDQDEAEQLHSPSAFERRLTAEAARRMAAWVELAEERLAGTDVQLFITAGNDDPPEVLAAAASGRGENVVYCDCAVTTIRDAIEMVSFGYSNPTPWDTPREVSEEELRTQIEELTAGLSEPRTSIFNLHVPPLSSGLDRCPELDTSTDPPSLVRIGGEVVMGTAGSSAVRGALQDHQPLVGLHGHIHESRASTRIGSTLALNPGSDYGESLLRGAIVAVDGSRVLHQFTAG
jgi:Icc-related predicted phosphoesterase